METVVEHVVGEDGYCFTCKRVPCEQPRRSPRTMSQLDRIETKLNKILRAMDIETEGG